jgi:hypothetical protein
MVNNIAGTASGGVTARRLGAAAFTGRTGRGWCAWTDFAIKVGFEGGL